MNFTATLCCYVLLPYFASLVFPPQEAITCYAAVGGTTAKLKKTGIMIKRNINFLFSELGEASPKEQSVVECNSIPKVVLETRYFIQNRDHYHLTDIKTWKQRYLIDDRYYKGNGIIFLRIGTDDEITEWNMQNGLWFEYCKKANALCVGIELRGYGVSLPHGHLSDKYLKYLTNEQALADVAWFIHKFRKQQTTSQVLPEQLKWVVHGRGKQGALAAWLRMKFPHLVHAAFSLSAPVLANESYDDYFKLIESEMFDIEEDFKGEIEKAYKEIKEQIDNKNFKELRQLFNFCDNDSLGDGRTTLSVVKNTEFMYFIFAQTLGKIMQFGNDDVESMKTKARTIMLDANKCKRFRSPMERFAHIIKKMLKQYNKNCLQINYDVAMNGYKTTDSEYKHLDYLFPEIFGNRTTLFQRCFELGQFETFDKFFGTSIELNFYTNFCWNVFERQYTSSRVLFDGVRSTNVFYGGLSIVVSHVFFVYGSKDPHRKLGVIDRIPEKSVTRLLEGAKYCYELDNEKSIPGINELKENIFHHLLEWLQ